MQKFQAISIALYTGHPRVVSVNVQAGAEWLGKYGEKLIDEQKKHSTTVNGHQ